MAQNSGSILSLWLESASSILADVCNSIINAIDSQTDAETLKFLVDLNMNKGLLNQIISECSNIGCTTLYTSFQVILAACPMIDITKNSQPVTTTNQNVNFIMRLTGNDLWNNRHAKTVIIFFREYLISRLAMELCRKLNSTVMENDEEINKFMTLLIQEIQTSSGDDFVDQIRSLVESNWRSAFAFLSYKVASVQNEITRIVHKATDNRLLLSIFSQVTYNTDNLDVLKDIVTSVFDIYKKGNCEYTSEFLLNLCSQILRDFKQDDVKDFLLPIYDALGDDLHSSQLQAQMMCFERENTYPLKCIHHACKKLDDGGDARTVIRMLIVFLRGGYFQEEVFQDNKKMFLINNDNIDNMRKVIMKWVVEHADVLKSNNTASDLTDLFVQIAACDFQGFIDEYLDSMCTDVYSHCKEAVMMTLMRFLSSSYPFKELADKEALTRVGKYAQRLCEEQLQLIPETEPVLYHPYSFTQQLQRSCSISDHSIEDVHRVVFELPDVGVVRIPKAYTFSLNRWKLSSAWKFEKDSALQFTTDLFDTSIDYIELSSIVLNLTLFVENSDVFIEKICRLAIKGTHSTATMAIRTLQCMIHLRKVPAAAIFRIFFMQSVNTTMTSVTVYNSLVGLQLLLEAVTFESLDITSEMNDIITTICIIGLCSPYYETRAFVLGIIKTFKTEISRLLEEARTSIKNEAKQHIIQAICPDKDSTGLQSIEFSHVAASQYTSLYIFYIAAFGKHLRLSRTIFMSLFDVANNAKDLMNLDYFAFNISALLLSISTQTDSPSQYFSTALAKSIERDNTDIIQIGMLSCASLSLADNLFMYIARYPRVFAYFLRQCTCNKSFVESHVSASNVKATIINGYLSFIRNTRKNGLIDSTPTFTISADTAISLSNSLYDLGYGMKNIFEEFARKSEVVVHGPFPRKPITKVNSDLEFCKYEDFVFWFNLCATPEGVKPTDIPYLPVVQSAFAAWCRISEIPDTCLNILATSLSDIMMFTAEIGPVLFRDYYWFPVTKTMFIENARTDYTFFKAIADQFSSAENFIENWQLATEEEMTEKELEFATVIFKDLGVLLAIAHFYLTSDNYEIRMTAFDFISVLIASAVLSTTKSTNNALNFLTKMESRRGNFISSWTEFAYEDIIEIAKLVVEYCPMVSEQFCLECFELERISSERIKESGSHTIGIIDSKKTQRLLGSLIIPWMTLYIHDLDNVMVMLGCCDVYHSFSNYSFVKSILSLKCFLPLLFPVTKLLDAIFDTNSTFFLTTCVFLYIHEKPLRKNCEAALLYVFTNHTCIVMDFFMHYLRVHMWYYYEIQTSKLGQRFDLLEFLGINAPDDEERENEYEELIWDTLIPFILDIIQLFVKEDVTGVTQYKSIILAFCAITMKTFQKQAIRLFTDLTDLSVAGKAPPSGIVQTQNAIGPWDFDVVVSTLSTMSDISQFLIQWGLGCGDCWYSAVALKLFMALNYTTTPEMATIALRCIYSVATVLYEVTSKKGKLCIRRSMKDIIDIKETDWNGVYACLEQLTHFISFTKPTADIISTAVALLHCKSTQTQRVVQAAVSTLLKNCTFLKQCADTDIGITNLLEMFYNSELEQDSMGQIADIIIYLLKEGLNKPFLGGTTSSAYLAIAPFLYARKNTFGLEQCVSNGDQISALYGIADPHHKESVCAFGEAFVTGYEEDNLIEFYMNIVRKCGKEEKRAAFILTGILLGAGKANPLSLSIATILREAMKIKDYDMQHATKNLIALMVNHNNMRLSRPTGRDQGFPQLKTTLTYKPHSWKPPPGDVFSNVSTFPPMFLTDLGFINSRYLSTLKNVVEQVIIYPVTQWNDDLFKSQVQQPSKIDSIGKLALDDDQMEYLIANVDELRKTKDELRQLSESTTPVQQISDIHTKITVHDEVMKCCTVDISVFSTPYEVIDKIGEKFEIQWETFSE